MRILTYTEGISKCRNYGLKQARLEPKVIRIFESYPPERCLVNLYGFYLSKRPSDAINALYLCPIVNPPSSIWFKNARISINQIATVVQKLTTHLKDGKTYSNNSLRRTTKTHLVENNVAVLCIFK